MTTISQNLIDGQARAAKNPATFHVPSRMDILSCGAGDYVKIGLETEEGEGERFWVKITKVEREGDEVTFTGRVDNDTELFPDYPYRALISFRPKHVLALI